MAIIIDSHCHPQFPQYDEDRDVMIQRALDAGIKMICIGIDLESSRAGIELAQKYEGMWATVGVHPNDNPTEVFDETIYKELLAMPKVVAMGEIGLDYYRTTEEVERQAQRERFEKQLAFAVKSNVPVVLHARDASKGSLGLVHRDMLSIIKNWKLEIKNSALQERSGVAHSFTGSTDEAKMYLDLGFYLGFNGIITFLPASRQALSMYDDLVKFVPLDRILLETDAPYLTPEPYRGQRNEPAHVIEVAKKLAELKGESLEEVVYQTSKNTQKLFKINGF